MATRTPQLRAALMQRYAGEAWALLWEVPDGTGMHKVRSADALAMSLWPSRGLVLHGFELKASRADWLKELKQPAKAESICRYCDHWWIVADTGVVIAGELPPTWGLLVLNGHGLVQSVVAPPLEPQPIDRAFLAGLLRSASKAVAKEDQKMLAAARQAGYDEGQKSASKHEGHWRDEHQKLSAEVQKFQEISGVRISKYGNNDAEAERVKQVLACDRALERARHDVAEMRRCVGRIETVVKEAEAIGKQHGREAEDQ